MWRAAVTCRRVIELAGIRLRRSHQRLHAARAHLWVYDQNVRTGRDQAHGNERCRIEAEFRIQAGVDDERRWRGEQRVTIRLRPADRFGGDVARRAGPTFDDYRLAPLRGELVADDARDDVHGGARWEADDHADRADWIARGLGR